MQDASFYILIIAMIGWCIVNPICKAIIASKNKKEDEGTELYYIHMDEYIEGLPKYDVLNIPRGHCYIAIKEELAFI